MIDPLTETQPSSGRVFGGCLDVQPFTFGQFPKLVAFTGYGGVGKDELARILWDKSLYAEGKYPAFTMYRRVAFGDIIKKQLDPLVEGYLGFTAFTENRTQKAQIRRTLESWGEDNYEQISEQFFDSLPLRAVNTRLCRVPEAKRWKALGGVVVEVRRPGVGPATPVEDGWLGELWAGGLVDAVLENHDSIEGGRQRLLNLLSCIERK